MGRTTLHGWFYVPDYGEHGLTAHEAFASALDAADELLGTMDLAPAHKHATLWASDGSPQAVWVDDAGYVGIGTATPGGLFQIGATSAATGFLQYTPGSPLYIYSGAGQPLYIYNSSSNLVARITNIGSINLRQTTVDKVQIHPNGDTFFNGGNFGVGLTAPTAVVDISGLPSTADLLRLTQSDVHEAQITLRRTGGTTASWSFYIPEGATDFRFYSGADRFTFFGNGNLGMGVTALGTSAAFTLGIAQGTAPSTAPADMAQMWVENAAGAAGFCTLHKKTETCNQKEIVVGCIYKTDTGDPASPYEGLMTINTTDNKVKIYAEGVWRQLATW